MKHINLQTTKKTLGLLVAFGLMLAFASTVYQQPALAQIEDVKTGVGITGDPGGLTIESAIEGVITVLSIVIGVISVIMIIIQGLKFVTSNGDATKAASARNGIIYAIVGLVVVVLAQVIVNFVLGNV